MFREYVDDYGNYVIAHSGRIGIGACYQRLGDLDAEAYQRSGKKDFDRKKSAMENYQKAVDHLLRVCVSSRMNWVPFPWRSHAQWLCAETYMKMGRMSSDRDYPKGAVALAAALMEELPNDILDRKPADDQMAQLRLWVKKALLIKAEACFLLAQSMDKNTERLNYTADGLTALNKLIRKGGPFAERALELKSKWSHLFERTDTP